MIKKENKRKRAVYLPTKPPIKKTTLKNYSPVLKH